jgi:cytochrome c oxidase subunit II
MNVDLYERLWMSAVAVMLALFFTTMAVAEFGHHFQPPSHVETIDPRRAMSDPRFRPQGVSVDAQGRVHARIVGLMFAWLPSELTLPADTPVSFHLTSADVTHGFEIVRTNGQTMVLPGYISQFTTQFAAGEYLIACNEYCGVGHHAMAAKLHVVPASQWTRPAAADPVSATEASHGH